MDPSDRTVRLQERLRCRRAHDHPRGPPPTPAATPSSRPPQRPSDDPGGHPSRALRRAPLRQPRAVAARLRPTGCSTSPRTRAALLERVKFLAIFSELLDEFFQVRVAGLEDQVAAGPRARRSAGRAAPARAARRPSAERATGAGAAGRTAIFRDHLQPSLAAAGIRLADWHALDAADRAHLRDVFDRDDLPDPDPAGRRPRAPVPVDLEPLAEPGGRGARPRDR